MVDHDWKDGPIAKALVRDKAKGSGAQGNRVKKQVTNV
jgi:hypothetical protein